MPDKKYLIEIPDMPDSSGVWDADKWERNKDKFMQKYPTANVFELGAYDPNDMDENDQFMLTFDNDEESSGVWDAAKWERNKDKFLAKYPDAHVNRVRYMDYWGDKAKSDQERIAELQQPDEERNARLAEIGYYDDSAGTQVDYANSVGLSPLSSAIEQNSVSGEVTYLDPRVEEFFANDTEYTDRQMELNRLRDEYEANPRVIEQREYEAQMARYAEELEKQIKADMEADVDAYHAGQGAGAKHMQDASGANQTIQAIRMLKGEDVGKDVIENEKQERYASALKLLQQAKDARNVAGKGMAGGVVDTAKDWARNLGTQSDIEMYNEVGNILTALEQKVGNLNEVSDEVIEENLTNDEKALIRAFFEYNAAMADAGEDMSIWYKGGKIFAESIPFMMEFLVTGGLANTAGRAATSWMGKGFGKWIAKSAKGTAARAAKKAVAKTVSGVAKTVVAAGARTLAAPTTYKNIAEQSVQYGADGHLDREGNMVKAAVDSYIEQLSEMSGAAFGKVLGGVGRLALGKTAFEKVGAWFGNNAVMQNLSKLGFHGLPEEVGEEIFGNALRTITGVDEEALSRMFEKDEFASMIIGFAPMTLFGAGMSMAKMGAVSIGAANAGRRMRQDLSRSYTEEQIDQVEMALDEAKDANEIANAIRPIIMGMQAAGAPLHEVQSVWDYAIAVAKKKAMVSAQSAQELQLAQAKIGEAQERMGGRFWIEDNDGVKSVKQVVLNNGNTAYVVSEPDQDGRVAIINATTGQKGTALPEDIKEESWNGTLNAFGTGLVMADRTQREQQRMQEDRAAQINEVRNRLSADPRINVGTEGSPIYLVAKSFNDAGVRYVAQDGSTGNISWEQAADSIGMPIVVKTDAQIAQEEAETLVAAAAERRAKRAKKDAVGTNERDNAVVDAENAVAGANEAARHIPMNEDGTVNEAAFWEQSPEEYVKWNDEQNQDGGQDSLQQVAIAKQELMGLLQEANAAQNTSNPTTRKAAKKEVERLADRIARLDAIEQSYMQSLEEEKAAVQQTAATPTSSMSEEDLESMDAQYQGILGKTRVQGERVRVMQEYLDKLAEGSVPVVLLTRQNYEEKMKADGLHNAIIRRVKAQVDAGRSVAGFMANGKVYLMDEGLNSIDAARITYIHERQHTFNRTNNNMLAEVANLLESKEKAIEILKTFVGEKGIDVYESLSIEGLADEIVAYSMEKAYTTEDFSVDLQSRGIPSEVISIITEIDNEQRKDQSLSQARRRRGVHSHAAVSGAGSMREDGRNLEQVSGGVLEQQAARPSGSSGRGAQIGEGAEVISETSDDEEPKGPDFRVTGEEPENIEDITEPDGTVRFSVRTYHDWTDNLGHQHKGTRAMVIEKMEEMKFSKRDIKKMVAKMDTAYEYMEKLRTLTDDQGRVRFEEFNEWAKATPLYKQVGRDYVKAITSLVSNGDYPINLELTTDCIKREAFTHLLNALVKRGAQLSGMGPAQIITMQKVMKQYGIEVACQLCFVEGKRLQIVNWASQIVEDWNDALEQAGVETDEYFEFGKDGDAFIPSEEWRTYEDKPKLLRALRAIDDAALLFQGIDPETFKAQREANQEVVAQYIKEKSEAWAKKNNKPASEWKPNDVQKAEIKKLTHQGLAPSYVNENLLEYRDAFNRMRNEWLEKHPNADPLSFSPTKKQWEALDKIRNRQIDNVKAKMVRLIMEHPEMRKKMTINDLLGSKGLMEIRQQHGQPYADLYSIILQRFGTGTPKPVQDAVPYDGEVLTLTESAFKKANEIGGARLFSFSDFDITKVFDYMQMFFDLEAKRQKLQSYTKEVAAVLIFGRSNAKFNISTLANAFVPAEVQEEYKKATEKKQKELRHKWAENAGLIVDENGTITGINFSEEHSVSPEFAQSIFRDDTRNKDCGAIMVGASVNHAIYSAAVNWIRMVIPFHLSGMPLAAREKTDVLWYTDNTEYQSTRKKTKDGWSKIEASKDTFNLYEGMDQPGWDMRQRAKDYLAWCAENGYRPKFDWGINSDYYRAYCEEAGYTPNQQIIDIMDADTTDGVWNQYYKFLTDFTAYKPVFNEQGEMIDEISSPQLAVESNFDFSEMEKEVLFEGENSMLGHREENIKRTENYIEEIADRVVPFLNGEISEEEMNLREDVHYENRADAELYLNAQKKSEGPIDLVEEAKKAQANDLMFRFIGEKAAQRLDAMVNATTMMDNLQTARDMEVQLNPNWAEKHNPEALKIKMATGWERGVDGMWRMEWEDFEYKKMPKKVKKTYKLSSLIMDSSLFVEYPELKDIEVKFKKLPRNTNGQLIPVGNSFRIELSEDLYQKMNPDYIAAVDNFTNEDPDRMSRILNHTASPEEISDFLNAVGSIPPRLNEFGGKDTLAHEIQHAIQHIEGFAIGGNVNMVDARDSQVAPFFARLGQEMEEAQKLLDEYNDLQGQLVAARIVRDNVQIRYLTSNLTMIATQYKVHYQNIQTIQKLLRNFAPLGESGYHRLSGEVEARNVAKRLDMSPEERRESIIANTQDVAHEDQIILRNYLMTDYAADTLVPGHAKGQPMLSDVEMLSDVSFRISNNTRRTIEGWCDKAGLAEDIKEGFIDHLEYTFDDTTEQLCAAKWYLNGTINLPNEDEYKVVGAVKVAKQNKVNPLLYYSPMDIFEKFGAPKEKLNPINPDKVSTLKNKTEVPGTDITIYDVEDSEESRKNMREIINTHYGKNASPWCLLQGDAYGNLSEKSAEYWEMYSAYPKQVAFKNGRLLAFSANSSRVRTWWDRMDKSYGGVPVAEKLNDAKNRRCSVEIDPKTGKEIKRSNIYSLAEKDGYTIKRNWNEVDGPMISAQKLKDDQVVAQFNRFTRDDFANDVQYFFYGRPKGIDMVFTLEKSMMFYENGELESYSVEGFRAAYARNSRKAWTITTRESTIREFSFNRQGRLIEYFDGQRLIKDRKTLAQVEVPSEYMDIVRRDPKSFMAEAEQLLVETGLAEAYEESQEDIRFRVLDTTNAELKEKPIKLNGMYRFNLKNAFKGVKDNGGSYPYIKVQLEEVPEGYSGEKIAYNGILEGFAVVRIPKGLITEGEKDNVFFIDPKAIENELWDVLRATENYYEFKHGNAPYQRDWMNADEVRFRVTPEQDKAYMDAVEAGDMETVQRMVDEAAAAAGYTIRGDHGRVSKFTIFDRDKANPEGNWGQGFYFTNNEEDVEENYATVDGPDLEAKIEREVERRVNLAEMNEEFNEDGEVDEFAIREEVEKEFITSEPNVVHAAIKMDNPFVVGHGMVEIGEDGLGYYDMQETYLTAEYETDEDGEADYSIDPTGTLVDLVEALNDELSEYEGVNINAYDILSDNIDGMTASQFEKEARELLENSVDYLQNDDLAIMTSEIIRAAIERAGFDGIVDNTVNQKFGTARRFGRAMEGVDENTRHYIAFQSSQIKETDPVTYDDAGNVIPLSERFNPENEDIRFRMRGENETAEEFVNGIIDDFKAKYNAFNEIVALDPTSKTQVAKFIGVSEEDISDEDMASFLKELEERDSRGWYNNKRIAIFVRKNVIDGKKSELVLIHENIHAINKEHPDLIAIGEYLWNTAQKGTREYKYKMAIAKAYPESEWFDEMSAYVVSEYMQDEQIDKLKSLLDSDNIESLNKLLNISGYGKDRSKQRARVTWNVLRKRPSETTEESGRTEEGGEPGDLRFRTTEITPEVRDEMAVIAATALVNGNYMKAPNGADTNLTAEQWAMVRTESFKAWFGDWENDPENASKVVDENGEPMVVYHGTQSKFTAFDVGYKGKNFGFRLSDGFYFSPDETVAESYASFPDELKTGEVKAVFLNIINPFYIKSAKDYREQIKEIASLAAQGNRYQADLVAGMSESELLSQKGYDGVVEKRTDEVTGEIVVFDPNQIKSATDNTGEFSVYYDIRFSIRTKPAPEKIGIGYKVFYLKDGKLYPPMVANLGGVDTPVGVWLDADAAPQAATSKTGRKKVKAGGKGTQGGSGTLAYRPGWHLGEIPYALQFNRGPKVDNPLGITGKNGKVIKVGKYFPNNFVWAEVEYANEVDYQDEAMSYGYNEAGNFQHSLAGLPKVPEDGSYIYRTNANPATDPWIITGAMKVTRLLTPSKVDQMVIDAGREPQERQEGAVTDEQIEALNKELGLVEEEEEVSFRTTGTPTEDVVAEGVSLSPARLASLAGDIFAALPEDSRKKITDGLNGNILGLQDAILQIPTSLATKEEWNDEDRQMAEVVAEQMTKAVGIEMTRPFSASEALWTLYNAVNKSTDLVSEASRALVRRNLGMGQTQSTLDSVQFRTSDSLESIDEIIQKGKQKVANENTAASDALYERISGINGNLSKLRSAAAAQREYDKNTVKIVADLANDLLANGAMSDMTRNEIKRLLSVIKDAVGKQNLATSVDRLMDIMIANQLRYGKNLLEKYLKIRGKRVDARGIEVRGRLDVEGQMIMDAFRDGITLDAERLEERIAVAQDKLTDESETVRRNAENDLVGYELARQFLEEVKGSEAEEKDLRDELKAAKQDHEDGKMDDASYRQFVKATYEAIRENRMQRVMAYQRLLEDTKKVIVEGVKKAGLLRDAEKARIERIHHYANSDLQGMAASAHEQKVNEFWNNPIVKILTSPLATFEQWMRVFGRKNPEGKGYLFNHFVGGWNKANNEEYLGVKSAHETLDNKVRSVFGGVANKWSDLFSIDKKMPKASIRMWDDGEMRDFEVTQGNLLYIYMVNKMTDGKMKLRKMGITEDDVNAIIAQMDPRFLELADWIQDEFLPSIRDKYNAVHERLFGAPMAAIDNYFPIKVLANARVREVDLGAEQPSGKPSTITGSIIKRTKNSLALDVLGSNAFDVVLEHIEQMEHWAAFAEFNRDLNTLLSYRKFRNRVQNMSTALGSGKEAWSSFKETAEIAAGVYQPKTSKIDKALTNAIKGLTAGKISFRLWTALKQTLSMPAFLPYANPFRFAKNLATPWVAWNWAIDNLPAFQKRWLSREAGNVRLKKTEADFKLWQTKAMEAATRWGMTPNAFVDAVTCSVGAKSVYDTMYERYISDGYSHEVADEKAKLDATVTFNATQQSSESAFVSAVQSDRTIIAHALTVFRNNSFGMGRELADALRHMKDRMKRGNKAESLEFMKKQMMREGLSEDNAERAAQRIYRNSAFKDAARIATFGFVMQFLWNLGNSALYLLFGDDDEEKNEMIKDAALRGAFGSAEGLGFGNLVPEAMALLLSGDIKKFSPSFSPAGSDMASLWDEMISDPVAGASDLINILAQVFFGANPQVLADAALAIYDACNGDMETSKEVGIALLRLLQAPQSNIDKLIMDEIDFSVDEGLDLTIEEFAKRYAEYKVIRNAPYTHRIYSDEKEKKEEDKFIKRFLKDAEEKKRRLGSEDAKVFYEYYDAEYETTSETIRDLRKKIKEAAKEGMSNKQESLVQELEDFTESEDFSRYETLLPKIKEYEAYKRLLKDAKTEQEREAYERKMLEARDAVSAYLKEISEL